MALRDQLLKLLKRLGIPVKSSQSEYNRIVLNDFCSLNEELFIFHRASGTYIALYRIQLFPKCRLSTHQVLFILTFIFMLNRDFKIFFLTVENIERF